MNGRRKFLGSTALAAAAMNPITSFASGFHSAIERTPKASAPSDLKITQIKCGYIRGGHSLFVKIYTNQQVWGCGEGVDATPGTYHLVKMFEERLKGKNP
ncbi:MAG TPA: hypothetical protein VLA46_09955, partial [Saprospiraceae bacterium]|nr:hypothetical protein [Saprospiraceae bacterium]